MKVTVVKKQTGKKDIVKIKGKSGYYVKTKSGKLIYGGKTVDDAKAAVARMVYFRDKGN